MTRQPGASSSTRACRLAREETSSQRPCSSPRSARPQRAGSRSAPGPAPPVPTHQRTSCQKASPRRPATRHSWPPRAPHPPPAAPWRQLRRCRPVPRRARSAGLAGGRERGDSAGVRAGAPAARTSPGQPPAPPWSRSGLGHRAPRRGHETAAGPLSAFTAPSMPRGAAEPARFEHSGEESGSPNLPDLLSD